MRMRAAWRPRGGHTEACDRSSFAQRAVTGDPSQEEDKYHGQFSLRWVFLKDARAWALRRASERKRAPGTLRREWRRV